MKLPISTSRGKVLACCAALAALSLPAAITLDAPGHVAVEGTLVAASGGVPGKSWALVDWRGRETGDSGVFDDAGKATLPPLKAGYYRLVGESRIPNPQSPNSPSLATLAVVPPPESRVMDHNSFYGIDSAQSWVSRPGSFTCPWNGGDTYRTVSDLIRLSGLPHVRERLGWGHVEEKPNAIDYGHYRTNAYLLHERGILVSGMFHDAPKWAGRLVKLPSDLNALYEFCAHTSAAFGDRMGDWEFWNEEDIGFAPEPVWDYAAALKAAYLGFKAGRPDGIVLPGALCQRPDSGYARALFENDAGKFGDVYNHHIYFPLSEYPKDFSALRSLMERYGIADRAVWITESGTHLEGTSEKDGAMKGMKAHTSDQELVVAEFYAKSQVAFQMEGVARDYFFVFGAYNEMRGAKDWGVMRRDGTVKPIYAAISAMTRELVSARLVGEMDVGGKLRAYLFEQPDGSQTVMFWSVSPMDTAGEGHVTATPDYARELVLHLPKVVSQTDTETQREANQSINLRVSAFPREEQYRLSDMCGTVSTVAATDGALVLSATRFPGYVAGLRGLAADKPARPRGRVRPYVPAADEDLTVIIRVDLNTNDFEIAGQKTRAVLKDDTGRLRVQVWNMGDVAKTGRVEVAGGSLVGLPDSIVLGPRGTPPGAFDCTFEPSASGEVEQNLVLTGVFDGKRSSRLSLPVHLEKRFLSACDRAPIDWQDLGNWKRNTSAPSYEIAWDETEQAVRFDVSWNDNKTDRWLYPVYKLKAPQESFAGAKMFQFEVKCAQDKVENDFYTQNLMLLFGDKKKTDRHIPYLAPLGSWETRYIPLSDVEPADLDDVTAFRLGANPTGTKFTFWIRNLAILKESGNAHH